MIKFLEVIITVLLGISSYEYVLKNEYVFGGILGVFAIINAVFVIRAYILTFKAKKEAKEFNEMLENMMNDLSETIEKKLKEQETKEETNTKKTVRKVWSAEEVAYLKKNYKGPSTLHAIADKLGRTSWSIYGKARDLKLTNRKG